MSLKFILGSSGSGKSHTLYQEIIEKSIEFPQEHYIVIVPEQFTMETQRNIVGLHPQRGSMNIDIVSFGRLAYRVFEEVFEKQLPVLDDTGKNLVLRRILENKRKELHYYASKISGTGFTAEMKSILSEFFQYGIQDKEMESMLSAAEKKAVLKAKLTDMNIIRLAFQDAMENKYVTKEEILEALCRVADKSEVIKKSVICLDGFTGFTPIQYKLMGLLIKYAKRVIVTVTIDPRENLTGAVREQELFHLSKTTVSSLKRISGEMGIPMEKDILITGTPYRFRKSAELKHLEASLFRYPTDVYEGETADISLHLSRTPAMEAAFAAREIRRLIREEDWRFRDMAVITSDMGRYADAIRDAFEEHDIPCFIDHKTSIMGNPFVELIRAALEMISEDFSYESVFRYLRTGLTDLAQEDIDYLENYCLALGIRGNKRWKEKWVRSSKKGAAADLDYLNGLREAVTMPLWPLWEIWRDQESDVRTKLTALYQLIADHGIQEKLESYELHFDEKGRQALAKEYKQTYRLVMELFDKVAELLGDEGMSGRELSGILDSGFEEIKVGLIPPSMDQVLVGDMERTRLKDIKALFFLGINDGSIPKNSGKGGLLSQSERNFLYENKVTLSPTAKENAYIQRFYLYMNLTKPSEHLYLSYCKTTSEGAALKASYLIGTIKKLFPKIETRDEEYVKNAIDHMTTPKGALSYLIGGLEQIGEDEMTDEWKELFSWYRKSDEWKRKTDKLIEAAFYENTESGIGRLAAQALYGPQPVNSVTRLERFASCAFAHFLTYGLHLEKRKEYQVLSVDFGNMFHNAIERYSKKLKENHLDFAEVTKELRKELVRESVLEITTDYGNNILQSSARNAYIIERLTRITDRTVWALGEQLKKGVFRPVEYEVSFSETDALDALTIPVSEEESMRLHGRIDRMDLYEDEEHVYVKVIDYKSGQTAFDLSSVFYGLQLQLVVYLDAAVELEKKKTNKLVIPAGIFYYNIKDPIVEKADVLIKKKEIEKLLLAKMQMNGLVNQEQDILKLLDRDLETEGKSDVIPVSYNKDGTLKKNASAITEEQFSVLTSFVKKKIRHMGREMMNGNTAIHPYEKGKRKACDYCDYRFVCGFDEKISGYGYRRMRELMEEEVWWEMLSEEGEKQDGNEMDGGTAEGN